MRRQILRWFFVPIFTLSVACASLGAKQQVSAAHQSIHAALAALDDYERLICQPAPTAVNTCTATPRVLSDKQHQDISRLLVTAFQADIRVGQAILVWAPGTPVPTDLVTLRIYVSQVQEIVVTLVPDEKTKQLLDLIVAVLTAVDQTARTMGGKV